MGFSEVSFATVAGKGTFRFIYNFYFLHIYIYTVDVQDQTKNSLWDDPYEGFPTTKGQSLVFGLPL